MFLGVWMQLGNAMGGIYSILDTIIIINVLITLPLFFGTACRVNRFPHFFFLFFLNKINLFCFVSNFEGLQILLLFSPLLMWHVYTTTHFNLLVTVQEFFSVNRLTEGNRYLSLSLAMLLSILSIDCSIGFDAFFYYRLLLFNIISKGIYGITSLPSGMKWGFVFWVIVMIAAWNLTIIRTVIVSIDLSSKRKRDPISECVSFVFLSLSHFLSNTFVGHSRCQKNI
jgi:hypothetical protein